MPAIQPPLDPKEALQHIRTLARVASESDELEAVRKILKEILNAVDKALPRRRRPDRHGD